MSNRIRSSLSLNLIFFIAVLFFDLFTGINFFIKNQFFSGNGTTNLTLFFSSIPYVCILIIPCLCWKTSVSIYDDFIPSSRLQKQFISFSVILIKFIILIITLIPQCLIVNLFGDLDWGQLFTSFFCLIFYGASLIALTLFINELFSSRVAALFISALIIALLNSSHLAAIYFSISNVKLNKFITSLCQIISFAWHFDAASKGIIDTRDIFWLSGLTFIMLLSSILCKELKAGKIYIKKQKIQIFLIYAVTILSVLNANRWYKRFDMSKNKTYSISNYSKKLIKEVPLPLTITYYCSSELSRLYPQIRDVSDFLSIYVSNSQKISYLRKNPDNDQKLISLLETYGITSQQMRTIKNNSTEYMNVFSAIVLEYNGNKEIIPFTMSAQTLEYDLDCRLKNLLAFSNPINDSNFSGDSYRIVNIIIGNGGTLSDDYSYIIPWLTNNGISCNILDINDSEFSSKLKSTSGTLLVIGDSKIKINEALDIENYILNEKGNALFLVSPYSSDIFNDWSLSKNSNTNIIEMLENWGIHFNEEIGADISCSKITMYSQDEKENPLEASSTFTQVLNYPLWVSILPQNNTPSGLTLFWPVPLTIDEENSAQPYLISSPAAYTYQIERSSYSKLIETNPFVLQEQGSKGKEKKTLTLAAKISGKLSGLYNSLECNNSNIIVIPDQYFVNSLMTGYIAGDYGDYRNFEFLTKTILELNNEKDLAHLYNRALKDESLYKITDGSTYLSTVRLSMILLFIIFPGIIIIIGVVVWILKKRNLSLYCSSLQ